MDRDVLDSGYLEFREASGLQDMRRDKNGFIRLTPTASRVDANAESLTTDISSLEEKLKRYREQKEKVEKLKTTEEYKESKKKDKSKKKKKERNALLEMVFNNADRVNSIPDTDEDDEENYSDIKRAQKKKVSTTLDTTYGKRFSPIVSMIYDSINEFDKIANDIERELETPQLRGKTMYRSTQIGNMISARNNKFAAVKELASVATTLSNLEYKKEKDKKAEEGSDTSKAISSLGAKFLRGGLDTDEDRKKKKDKKSSKKFGRFDSDEDDDDSDIGSISRSSDQRSDTDDRELAAELAKALGKHKDITFTPHERFAALDGTYTIMVVCDPLNPDNTAKFVAVDKKGKIIPNFKDEYPGLLPKRKLCKFVFDLGRKRVTDKNSGRSYKLMFDN